MSEPQGDQDLRPDYIPTLGDTVYYCLDQGNNKGTYRPAIIVRVWSPGLALSSCQLQVFTDSSNDGLDSVYWATSRQQGHGLGKFLSKIDYFEMIEQDRVAI